MRTDDAATILRGLYATMTPKERRSQRRFDQALGEWLSGAGGTDRSPEAGMLFFAKRVRELGEPVAKGEPPLATIEELRASMAGVRRGKR